MKWENWVRVTLWDTSTICIVRNNWKAAPCGQHSRCSIIATRLSLDKSCKMCSQGSLFSWSIAIQVTKGRWQRYLRSLRSMTSSPWCLKDPEDSGSSEGCCSNVRPEDCWTEKAQVQQPHRKWGWLLGSVQSSEAKSSRLLSLSFHLITKIRHWRVMDSLDQPWASITSTRFHCKSQSSSSFQIQVTALGTHSADQVQQCWSHINRYSPLLPLEAWHHWESVYWQIIGAWEEDRPNDHHWFEPWQDWSWTFCSVQ